VPSISRFRSVGDHSKHRARKRSGLTCALTGNHSEACFAKYGCTSLRGKHCHESALRIVLACVEAHANRAKRHIEPLLCVHMDFYVRCFVRVYTSAAAVKRSASKQAMVYQCTGCGAFHFQPLGKV
jgi:tRNA (guanine26-N2/guanine27-N2)-dimethyltransferase